MSDMLILVSHPLCPYVQRAAISLTEKGVPFENWNGEKSKLNRHAIGFQQIYLRDPDGYWIEINDVEPSRKLTKLY